MSEEIKSAIDLLEKTNQYIPKASVLDELKMVIKRLKFSELNQDLSHRMKAEKIKDKLSLIFKEEISNQMLGFLHKLADQNNLKVVFDDLAQQLIDEADKYYSQVKEVSVTVAVELTDDFKNWLEPQILSKFTSPTRIIFTVDDSITAGLIIKSRDSYLDLSFEKNILPLVRNHLTEKLTQIKL